MKQFLFFLFFVLMVYFLSAQSVWQVHVPCEDGGCSSFTKNSLIKTSDGNFLVGLWGQVEIPGNFYQHKIYLYKYDQEGFLIWDKSYHFGATTPASSFNPGPRLYRFIEDINGDIICVGSIVDGSKTPSIQAYFFRADSEGDSLNLTVDSTFAAYTNLILLENEEYFALRVNGFNKLDLFGEIIGEVDINDFASSLSGILIDDYNIFVGRLGNNPYFADSSEYDKYDLYTGELILQKKYVDIGDLLIFDNDDHIVAYSSGLMKMDTDFSPIWVRPFEDFEISTLGYIQTGQAILKTEDGGFILGGDLENGLTLGVFLIKTDNQGFVEWRVAHNGFSYGIEYMFGLVQADDGGFVFLGGGDNGYYKLVKLNSNGLFTNTHEISNSSLSIQVFPNPCQKTLFLSSSEPLNGTIRIFNAFGKQIQQFQASGNSHEINTQNLSPGIYFLEWIKEGKEAQVLKFIKQ